jgi:superfamily II RNA helicase
LKSLKNGDKNVDVVLKKYRDRIKKLKSMEYEIEGFQEKINIQISILLSFLKKNKLLDKDNLTTLGYIVSEISDCNPIVLAYIIENNHLDKLSFSEIVAFLSIFINDSSINTDDEPNLSDLVEKELISKDFEEVLLKISEFTEDFGFDESKLNSNNKLELPYPINSDWQLHLKLFESVKLWTEGKSWNESVESYKNMFCSKFNRYKRIQGPNSNNIPSSFEGNFIKNILRLSNIVRSVESISMIINNHTLSMKLEGFQEKMLRDEVTTDSLYIFNKS